MCKYKNIIFSFVNNITNDNYKTVFYKDIINRKNDPRISIVGAFIRKFSIDELPQLINIIKGDMENERIFKK